MTLPISTAMANTANMAYALGYDRSLTESEIYGQYPNSIYNNPYMNYGYNNFAPAEYPQYPQYTQYPQQNQQNSINLTNNTANNQQNILTEQDVNSLTEDYKKSLSPSEGLFSCIVGGAGFAALNNPRLFAHPYNTYQSHKAVKAAFKDVKTAGSELNKLWLQPENSNILREAYLMLHKTEARKMSKLGAFRAQYTKEDAELISKIQKELKKALEQGNMEKITECTAKLRHSYVSDGFIAKGFNKVKGWFGGKTPATVAEALEDTKGIENVINGLNESKNTKFSKILKRGGGIKGGVLFAAIELLTNFDKIKTAFSKDSSTGMKQTSQTIVKATGNAAGWALGEAASTWAFTKWGAKIGSKIHPVVGTLIGGVVGLVGGSLGMWLTGKLTNGLVGKDVADDIKAKELASTSEGQMQLLQNTIERIQSGEKVSPEALATVQKLIVAQGKMQPQGLYA